MGSCFAERIGRKMADSKFRVQINPMGIAYNPVSLARLLRLARTQDATPTEEIFSHEGRFHSFDFHSSFSDPEPHLVQEQIRDAIEFSGHYLRSADVVILTFGTAFGFRHYESGEVVNNCHKVPAREFEKCLLDADLCYSEVECEIREWQKINPKLKFILTVSPVRHTREGLAENNLSKAYLRILCDQLSNGNDDVVYFPAYEIMMDDLRDYRFYQDDLIHPNAFAEQYIWEKFAPATFDENALKIYQEWESLRKSLAHKPFNPQGEAYRRHLENLLEKMEEMNLMIDVQPEIEVVKEKLEMFYF